MLSPKSILDRLEFALGPQSAPRGIIEAIEHELVHYFKINKIQAAERAEVLSTSVLNLINKRMVEAESNGTDTILIAIGSTSNRIIGASYILPSDNPRVAKAKSARAASLNILKKIQSLSFAEFELFGSRILDELGATKSHVTRHAGDQGIDFFGSFSFDTLHSMPTPFLKLAQEVRLLFAGQAKHYPKTAIGPSVIRELIGSVSLARTKTFSTDGLDIFKELDIRPFSPVIALLFTTGRITKGARELASRAGIIAKGGDQLAIFLADRGVGVRATASGYEYSGQTFDQWLHKAEQ